MVAHARYRNPAISENEHNVYCLRPNRTALWLPSLLAEHLGISPGDQLAEALYESADIQDLLQRRQQAEGERGAGAKKLKGMK